MKVIIYDRITGEITGRITCSTGQAKLYPIKPDPKTAASLERFRAVTAAEYDERPELFQKVDVDDRAAPLVALSEKEALDKGASVDFINEKIAEGKMVRAEKK